MFNKLPLRLSLLLVGLILAPVFLAAIGMGIWYYNNQVDRAIETQQLQSQRFEQAIADLTAQRVDELHALVQVNGLNELDIEQQQALLSNLLVEKQAYNLLVIADPDGQERVKVSRLELVTEADLGNRAEDALFNQAIASESAQASEVFFDPSNGEPLLTIAVPLYDLRSGELSSVVLGDFRLELIGTLITELQTSTDSDLAIYLLNSTGQVVAHPNPTIVLQRTEFEATTADGEATGLENATALITTQELSLLNQTFLLVSEQPTVADDIRNELIPLAALVILVGILVATVALMMVGQVLKQPTPSQ